MSNEHRPTLNRLLAEVNTTEEGDLLKELAVRAELMEECAGCHETKHIKSACPFCGHGLPTAENTGSDA